MSDRRFVGACENGSGFVRPVRVFERHTDTRTRFPGRAAANRIRHHEHGPARGTENAVNVGRRAGFFEAEARQILAHGDDQHFRVRHVSEVIIASEPEIHRGVLRFRIQ